MHPGIEDDIDGLENRKGILLEGQVVANGFTACKGIARERSSRQPLHRICHTEPSQVRHRLGTEIILRDINRRDPVVQRQQVRGLVSVLRPFDRSVAIGVERRSETDEVVLEVPGSGGPEDVLEIRTVRLHT